MPDWSANEDRYMAAYRGEAKDDAPPPCPNCDGPVVEGEGVLCDECLEVEVRQHNEILTYLTELRRHLP